MNAHLSVCMRVCELPCMLTCIYVYALSVLVWPESCMRTVRVHASGLCVCVCLSVGTYTHALLHAYECGVRVRVHPCVRPCVYVDACRCRLWAYPCMRNGSCLCVRRACLGTFVHVHVSVFL